MLKAGIAYERPSRLSQALVVGFSLAVVAMTGWLLLMIMHSHDANTKTVDVVEQTPPPPEPPRVENPPPDNLFPLASTVRPVTVTKPAPGWDDRMATGTSSPAPATTYAAASLPRETSAIAPSPSGYVRPSPGTADDYRLTEVEGSSVALIDIAQVPLPHPRPRHLASIPMPRPRPQIDETPQQPQERSLFEVLFNSPAQQQP
jgi:hypothetical protein